MPVHCLMFLKPDSWLRPILLLPCDLVSLSSQHMTKISSFSFLGQSSSLYQLSQYVINPHFICPHLNGYQSVNGGCLKGPRFQTVQ